MKSSSALSIGLVGGFLLLMLFLVIGSLATEWRFPALFPESYTLVHWESWFQKKAWIYHLALSLLLSTAVSITAVGLGLMTASKLSRDEQSSLWLRLSYLPYGLSPVLYAYSMQYFYQVTGLAGTWLGVYLAQLILVYPFAVVLFFTYFDSLMHHLEDQAASLGASKGVVFQSITLPILRRPIQTILIQLFLVSWFDYGITSVIGSGQLKTLTLMVYQYIGESNLFYSSLASCILMAPPLILWLLQPSRLAKQTNPV